MSWMRVHHSSQHGAHCGINWVVGLKGRITTYKFPIFKIQKKTKTVAEWWRDPRKILTDTNSYKRLRKRFTKTNISLKSLTKISVDFNHLGSYQHKTYNTQLPSVQNMAYADFIKSKYSHVDIEGKALGRRMIHHISIILNMIQQSKLSYRNVKD